MKFTDWLQTEMKMKPASAKVYQSNINYIEKTIGVDGMNSIETLNGLLKTKVSVRPAYRLYARYMQEINGKFLPPPPDIPLGRPPAEKDAIMDIPLMPIEVVDAVVDCVAAGLDPKTLKSRTWGHVIYNEAKSRYETPEATGSRAWIILPKEAIDTIRAWAQPKQGHEIYSPLVPMQPGSTKPVNLKWLLPLIEVRMSIRAKS